MANLVLKAPAFRPNPRVDNVRSPKSILQTNCSFEIFGRYNTLRAFTLF
jgi:hypothetical protein